MREVGGRDARAQGVCSEVGDARAFSPTVGRAPPEPRVVVRRPCASWPDGGPPRPPRPRRARRARRPPPSPRRPGPPPPVGLHPARLSVRRQGDARPRGRHAAPGGHRRWDARRGGAGEERLWAVDAAGASRSEQDSEASGAALSEAARGAHGPRARGARHATSLPPPLQTPASARYAKATTSAAAGWPDDLEALLAAPGRGAAAATRAAALAAALRASPTSADAWWAFLAHEEKVALDAAPDAPSVPPPPPPPAPPPPAGHPHPDQAPPPRPPPGARRPSR